MKTLGTFIVAVMLIAGAVFAGWFIHYENNVTMMDKANYWYSTEIKGQSDEEFILNEFVSDATNFWEDLTK